MRISDWSSDVCSSGLVWRFGDVAMASGMNGLRTIGMATGGFASLSAVAALAAAAIGWRLARETEHGGTRSTGDAAPCSAVAWRARLRATAGTRDHGPRVGNSPSAPGRGHVGPPADRRACLPG